MRHHKCELYDAQDFHAYAYAFFLLQENAEACPSGSDPLHELTVQPGSSQRDCMSCALPVGTQMRYTMLRSVLAAKQQALNNWTYRTGPVVFNTRGSDEYDTSEPQ